MKIIMSCGFGATKPSYPYLARHKKTGALVLVSKYCAIVVESSADGAWTNASGFDESIFEPLPIGFYMTVEND